MEARTRFADWPRHRVLAVFGLAVALMAGCLWAALARHTLPLTEDSERIPPRFKLTAQTLAQLEAAGVPASTLTKLQPLVDVNFPEKKDYRARLAELLPAKELDQYGELILDLSMQGDLDFYKSILERVRGGQDYYDALTAEFQDIQFISNSVFNWRTPIYAWVMGRWLPFRVAQGVLIAIATLTMLLWYAVIERELGKHYASLALLLIGPFTWCALGDIFIFTEVWAGTLIALSIACYALGSWPAAVAAGLCALFFRELTAPYCLLCLAFALYERRRVEVLVWIIGLAIFGYFYYLHATEVARRLPELAAAVEREGWIRFGGLPFMIGTSQMNVFLIYFPSWVAAICLPLSLLGLAGWPGRTGLLLLLTATGYLAAFSVLGMPNNAYWGLMNTPLLALGLAALPACVRDLWSAAQSTKDMP